MNRQGKYDTEEITREVTIEVNKDACHALASLIITKSIPVEKEDNSLQGFSPEQIGNFYLFLVAICHQTSPRGLPPLEGRVFGATKRGWDYLTAKFEESARHESDLLAPTSWARMSTEELSALYRDAEVGDRLTGVAHRAALIRDLGKVMEKNRWACLQDLYRLCAGRAGSGDPNLYGLLFLFQAYRDPMRKKSSFLLTLMRNTGLWHFVDDDQVGVPVDYHEVRGHLRLGTIAVRDENLRRKLLDSLPVTATEDLAIRQAVHDAIVLISKLTACHTPAQLHYLFWNVFRSCCTRESPHCQRCPTECSLPERYVPLAIQPNGHRQCPFSGVCASANSSQRYYEHVFDTDYY